MENGANLLAMHATAGFRDIYKIRTATKMYFAFGGRKARATARNISRRVGDEAPASATSRGQFAKQFRLENERVRSTSHYVTVGRRRGVKEAWRTAEGGSETATNHPLVSRLMLRSWDVTVHTVQPRTARLGARKALNYCTET